MKLDIAVYADYDTSLLEEQLELLTNMPDTLLLVRKINNKQIYELTNAEIKLISSTLKKLQTRINSVNPLIDSYQVDDVETHKIALAQFTKSIDFCRKTEVDKIHLRLPYFDDIIASFDKVEQVLIDYVNIALRSKIDILLEPSLGHKSNVYVYIFRNTKFKNLFMVFDSSYLVMNEEPLTTSYRLLRDHIKAVTTTDVIRKDKTYELIGYGDSEIIDLFKRLHRDNFTGFLILENKIPIFKVEERGLLRKLFKRNPKLEKPLQRIKNDGIITVNVVLENQYQVLRKIFK